MSEPSYGRSIRPVDGFYLWEPYTWLVEHKPACHCDDRVKAWTFADWEELGDGRRQVFCQKCGAKGGVIHDL